MRRRILLVDDEVAVLLTLKAVLEISGFEWTRPPPHAKASPSCTLASTT